MEAPQFYSFPADTTLQLQQQVMAVSSRQADTKDPKKPAGGKEDENLMAAQTKICALESELVQVTKSLKKKYVFNKCTEHMNHGKK